jgi:pimeloyl-ACP methyl ester carboxylesterase
MRCSFAVRRARWRGKRRAGIRWIAVATLVLVVAAGGGLAPARSWADEDEEKPLPPEDITLGTRDGVSILATYYPSKLGKDAVPVVLLHAAKGVRGDFTSLALRLQEAGHAVIAPDLRGHGDSAPGSGNREAGLRRPDFSAMVNQDVEAVKSFLVERNNARELNIEKLCLVGLEMGSVIALNFTARDWSWPPLAIGKQGQDVKALVLVSPEWSYRGLRINEAVAHPQVRRDVSVIIIAGKGGSKQLREAKRLYSAFERYHPTPLPEEAASKQTLWLRTLPTTLQGTKLLRQKRLGVDEMIEKFIELRLSNLDIPWQERARPL